MSDPLYATYLHRVMDIVCVRLGGLPPNAYADLVDMWIQWNWENERLPHQAAEYVINAIRSPGDHVRWHRGSCGCSECRP